MKSLAHPPPLVGAGRGGGSHGSKEIGECAVAGLSRRGGPTPSVLPDKGRKRNGTIRRVDSKARSSRTDEPQQFQNDRQKNDHQDYGKNA